MERKSASRARGFLRPVASKGETSDKGGSLAMQEVMGLVLGFRLVFSEQAEIWTVRGILRDGSVTKDDVGEFSFVIIPGDGDPAIAIVGYLAAPAPYLLKISEEAMWAHLRGFAVQLGYDQEGYYISLGYNGQHRYYEETPKGHKS